MNLTPAFIVVAVLSVFVILGGSPAYSEEKTAYLSVCQELVSQARAYEARATAHGQVAKSFKMQIDNLGRMPRTQFTTQQMDQLFSYYDQNRDLEKKFRDLYRQSSDEAKKCMNSAE